MPPSLTYAPRILPAAVLAFALLGALSYGGWRVVTQARMAPGTAMPAEALAPQHTAAAPQRGGTLRTIRVPEPVESVGPGWGDLTAAQQEALAPLNERWPVLSEAQKRHWLNLASTFRSLPAEERAKMVERMTEWANLSIQQRNQARFNYAATARLAPDSKRARWEAYQALSPEEKHRLAAHATPKPTGAATALHPASVRKLAKVPAAAAAQSAGVPNLPKITRINNTHALQALPVPAAWPMLPASASGVGVETSPVSMPAPAAVTSLPPANAAATPSPPPAEPDTRDFTPLHPPQ